MNRIVCIIIFLSIVSSFPVNASDSRKESGLLSTITVSCVGDCTLGSDPNFGYEDTLPHIVELHNGDLSYLFKNVAAVFKQDDITTINLENAFTARDIRADKTFTFKGSPEYAVFLKSASIEAVNLANNHTYDFLQQGFYDTLNALKKADINYFGEGYQYIKNVRGVKIAFLGYNLLSSEDELYETMKQDICRLKEEVSLVIINLHGGLEGEYYPEETQVMFAHHAVDCGADLIIGHHPHVIQGIEKYKQRIICYSLGNFCFGGNINPSDKDTFIFQIKFNFDEKKLISYELRAVPCRISSVDYMNDYCPAVLTGDDKVELLMKLNGLSPQAGFKISDEYFTIKLTR